jgi:hypothetical protein
MQLIEAVTTALPVLAQASSGGPWASLSWGIVLFFPILGVILSVTPAKRTYEVKKPKED